MRVLITASGIQEYIFSVNERQASKRLRGRSARLGLVIDLCHLLLLRRFGTFEVKRDAGSRLECEILDGAADVQGFCDSLRQELDSHSLRDLNAQVWFAVATGDQQGLHAALSKRKLNLGCAVLQSDGQWNEDRFVFAREPNERALEDISEAGKIVLSEAELGRDLVRFPDAIVHLEPWQEGGKRLRLLNYSCQVGQGVSGDGILVELSDREKYPLMRLAKRLARHAPVDKEGKGDLLDFEAMADSSTGASFLGVLKADLDNLGEVFENLAGQEERARQLSSDLDLLFATEIKTVIDSERGDGLDYSLNYIVYSGGDDLFMFGPWDRLIRFIDEFHRQFEAKLQRWMDLRPKLTLSAGFKLAHPKSPVRFLAEDVEEAVTQAKGRIPFPSTLPPKNRIVIFEQALDWAELKEGLNWADRFVTAIKDKSLSAGFLQRFLFYASQFRRYEAGYIDGLRMVPLLQNDWYRNSGNVASPLREELSDQIALLLRPMQSASSTAWRSIDFASRFAIYANRNKE